MAVSDGKKWYDVGRTTDLSPGEMMYVEVGRDPVVLISLEDGLYALSDICTHQDASLSDGEIIGDEIECPLHGGAFEIRTGLPANMPVVVPVETYDVKVEDGIIFAARKDER